MLITPLMAGIGGLLAFFTVVFVVVWLPIHTFDPPPSDDWAPLSDQARQGPEPVRLERLLRLPLGLLAATGRARGALLPLPEGLAARRLLRQRPVAEPARHRAHRARPLAGVGLAPRRLAVRALLRPALHGSALADAGHEVALLRLRRCEQPDRVRRDNAAASRACCATRASSTRSTSCSPTRATRRRTPGFHGRAQADRRALHDDEPQAARRPARGGAEPRRRSTAATGSPAIRCRSPSRTCSAARRSSSTRCVGCHGLEGRRQGARARASSPRRRPTSPTRTTPAAAATPVRATSTTGSCAAGPGTAMENFGDRLSVDDIWRVVLFVKTIPNGTLAPNRIPEPKRLHRLAALEGAPRLGQVPPEAGEQRRLLQEAGDRSVHAGGDARLPGPCSGDHLELNNRLTRRCRSQTRPPGSRRSTRTCSTAPGATRRRAARSSRRRRRRRSRRRCRASNETSRRSCGRADASSRSPGPRSPSRTTSRRRASRAG